MPLLEELRGSDGIRWCVGLTFMLRNDDIRFKSHYMDYVSISKLHLIINKLI